jgi:membrane fusion protein, multidrug efflux system
MKFTPVIWPGLLLAVLLPTTGCKERHEASAAQALEPALVRLHAVQSGQHTATEDIVGTVRAKRRATLEAKVGGRIEQLLAAPGQQVKAGQLLAQLDVREIQARLDQASAVRQQTEGDLKRFSALLEQQAVTQAEFEAVQARQRVAEATVTEMETLLDHASVTAPFDGVITRKLADVGDMAAPGKPLLEMEDPRALRLDADVPEAIISRIEHGTPMMVRIASLPGELEGVVSEMAPAADPNSRTFQVKYDLPVIPGLRAGQFGRVSVPLGESRALWAPASALVQRGQLEIVFVAEGQRASLRLVKTGKRQGDLVELVSGVSAGEQIVVEGAAQLRDGQRIEIKI